MQIRRVRFPLAGRGLVRDRVQIAAAKAGKCLSEKKVAKARITTGLFLFNRVPQRNGLSYNFGIPSRPDNRPRERAMPDDSPDKILIGISNGRARSMARLADGTYADRVAVAAGAGLVTDKTGKHTFDLGSLASKFTYDTDGNQTSVTYGPDPNGLYVRQTSTWENGLLMSESAWELVTP